LSNISPIHARKNLTPDFNNVAISRLESDKVDFNKDNKDNKVSNEANDKIDNSFKVIACMTDLKFINLIHYNPKYDKTFEYHKDIKENGYFGYIFRIYSSSFKYNQNKGKTDDLKCDINLFTASFLSPENFEDSRYFVFDKELKYSYFFNLKKLIKFNLFMELEKSNKIRMINKNFISYFDQDKEYKINKLKQDPVNNNFVSTSKNSKYQSDNSPPDEIQYEDLIFNNKHTLIKIFEVSFKRETSSVIHKEEDIYILANDLKLTWNKFNMDVLHKIIIDDFMLIVDKIVLNKKDKENDEENNEQIAVIDFGRFNFKFELVNPQICVQNELTKSKILLTTRKNCKVTISKICLNENSKDITIDVNVNYMNFYVPPNFETNSVYWIGNSNESEYYL